MTFALTNVRILTVFTRNFINTCDLFIKGILFLYYVKKHLFRVLSIEKIKCELMALKIFFKIESYPCQYEYI